MKIYTIFLYLLLFSLFIVYDISAFTLIAIGDSRSGFGNEDFERTGLIIDDAIDYVENKISEEIIGIVMTGDYVSDGNVLSQWNTWVDKNERAFGYPIYPCIGNHDDQPKSFPWWLFSLELWDYENWHYQNIFNVDRWYSATIREVVNIISIDSNLEGFGIFPIEGDILELFQYLWYLDELEKNKDLFNIVIFHEPAYGSHTFFGKGHGSNRFMRQRYIPPAIENDVELVLTGHNHWLEFVSVDGIEHITTGGGGAPLTPVSIFKSDRVEGSYLNMARYHYCILSIDEEGEEVYVEAIEYDTHKVLGSTLIKKK